MFIAFLCTNEAKVRMDALVAVLDDDVTFKVLALQLLEKCNDSLVTSEFEQMMNMVWQSNEKDEAMIVKMVKEYDQSNMAIVNIQQAFQAIPSYERTTIIVKLLDVAKKIVGKQVVPYRYRALSIGQKLSGVEAQVFIVAVLLSIEILRNIASWWRGEISGKRCVKQIVDFAFTTAGGFGGGFIGSIKAYPLSTYKKSSCFGSNLSLYTSCRLSLYIALCTPIETFLRLGSIFFRKPSTIFRVQNFKKPSVSSPKVLLIR